VTSVIGHQDDGNGWASPTMVQGKLVEQPRAAVQDIPGDTQVGPGIPREALEELNANYPYPFKTDGSCAIDTHVLVDVGTMEAKIVPRLPLFDSNQSQTASSPKTLDSSHKIPVNLCPASAIIAIALVIAQGHKKPGRTIYNWRTQKISYSEYLGAALRHILKSNDGSDHDKELSDLAGVPVRHDWAAMSCLAIIEDARQAGTLVDDRPVKGGAEQFLESLMVKK
jgi:hypothetical protein